MKDTVIITGIAGLIASHTADRLLPRFHVVGLDDLSGGNVLNVPNGVEGYKGSCGNAELVEAIFTHHKPKFVIHCAAMAAENLSHNCRRHTYQNNLVGEATIRNACVNHDVQCMVSTSSIAVMGHQTPPFTEEDQPMPRDSYGIAKLAGELDAQAAKDFFDLNYVTLRPHNVIGTRQNLADRFRNVASIFIRAIKEGEPLPIFGDGLQTRAFSPVSYVADIIAASIERPGTWNQTYNVGSDEPMTILALHDMLERITGESLRTVHHGTRKEAVHAHMVHDKVRAAFPDILPQETVEQVLTDMLHEALRNPTPAMQKGPDIEITKNLPPIWKP